MAIKVLFHLNQIGFGGTEKAILSFCQNIDRTQFEPYLFIYNTSSRIKYLRYLCLSKVSNKHNIRFTNKFIHSRSRLPDFLQAISKKNIFEGDANTFKKTIAELSPDIIHFNRGKWEPFFDDLIRLIPESSICVETNIFGFPASDDYFYRLKKTYFVSKWLLDKSLWSGPKGSVLYNPIKKPANTVSIRSSLGITEDAFVFGRISRPDLLDDDFILEVFSQVQEKNTYLLVLAGSEVMRNAAKNHKNIKLIDATTDENIISNFYNSIDLLLHYRIDGETFGMNIAEAMIHGKPVISHLSHIDNAQAELLADTKQHGIVGYIAPENDKSAYIKLISKLMNNPEHLETIGINAKIRAQELFQEDIVTHYLEDEYKKLLVQS